MLQWSLCSQTKSLVYLCKLTKAMSGRNYPSLADQWSAALYRVFVLQFYRKVNHPWSVQFPSVLYCGHSCPTLHTFRRYSWAIQFSSSSIIRGFHQDLFFNLSTPNFGSCLIVKKIPIGIGGSSSSSSNSDGTWWRRCRRWTGCTAIQSLALMIFGMPQLWAPQNYGSFITASN